MLVVAANTVGSTTVLQQLLVSVTISAQRQLTVPSSVYKAWSLDAVDGTSSLHAMHALRFGLLQGKRLIHETQFELWAPANQAKQVALWNGAIEALDLVILRSAALESVLEGNKCPDCHLCTHWHYVCLLAASVLCCAVLCCAVLCFAVHYSCCYQHITCSLNRAMGSLKHTPCELCC